jgi:hypothetical protein
MARIGRLRCKKCGINVSGSWAFIWHPHDVTLRSAATGAERSRRLWLCPDCAGEFKSDKTRNAFLRSTVGLK